MSAVGASLLLDSDTHEPIDMLTPESAKHIAIRSAVSEEDVNRLLVFTPLDFLKRLGVPLYAQHTRLIPCQAAIVRQ